MSMKRKKIKNSGRGEIGNLLHKLSPLWLPTTMSTRNLWPSSKVVMGQIQGNLYALSSVTHKQQEQVPLILRTVIQLLIKLHQMPLRASIRHSSDSRVWSNRSSRGLPSARKSQIIINSKISTTLNSSSQEIHSARLPAAWTSMIWPNTRSKRNSRFSTRSIAWTLLQIKVSQQQWNPPS